MNNNLKLKVFDLILSDEEDGVSKISLVEAPAIERDFILMSEEYPIQLALQSDKQILTTPVLLAGQKIYRRNDMYGEHYVRFNKKTIESIVQKYFRDGNQLNFNLEHSEDINGVYMFESYITNKERGINAPVEFKNIPDGSWMASFKVENKALWDACKNGQFKGVSVEALMKYKPAQEMDSELHIFEEIYRTLCAAKL